MRWMDEVSRLGKNHEYACKVGDFVLCFVLSLSMAAPFTVVSHGGGH